MKTLVLLEDYSGFKKGDEIDAKDEDVESLIADGIAKEKVEITKHAEEKEGCLMFGRMPEAIVLRQTIVTEAEYRVLKERIT